MPVIESRIAALLRERASFEPDYNGIHVY